jgi:uncharacterized protein (DUF2342 family)
LKSGKKEYSTGTYIARAGVDMEQLDEKFTGTKVESLKHELAQEREQSKLKGARIEFLETKLEKIERYLHLVVDVLLEAPSIEQLKAELRRRRVASLAT